jgi:hypothetical protein
VHVYNLRGIEISPGSSGASKQKRSQSSVAQ